MTKHKKLFGLFAIMFVALFSVGCVFATACGKKNKESDEESEIPAVEHVHDYQPTDWAFSADYTTCTATLTCVSTTGECDAPTNGTVSATVTSVPTDATCTAYAYTTYTATYGDNVVLTKDVTTGSEFAAHTYTETSKASFDWTNFDEDNLSGVTATVECDVCHAAAEADSVTAKAVKEKEDTYVATATLGTCTYESAEYVVGGTTGGEEDVFAITLGQSSVSLDGTVSSKDVSVSITLNNAPYAGSDADGYDIVISSTNEGIASVTKSVTDGKITVSTAAVSGTATVTVAVVKTDDPKTAIESEDIAVTVTGVGPDTAGMASQSISFAAEQAQDYTSDLSLYSDGEVSVVAKASTGTDNSGKHNQQVTIDQGENPEADPERDGVTYYYRLKLNGTGKYNYRNVTITTTGAAVIRFVLYSGSSSEVRTAEFYKLDGTTSTLLYSNDGVRGYGDLVVWTVAVEEAGTYYMASKKSGINIYAIDVLYESTAEPAPSEDAYTVTITSSETTMTVGDSISLGATVQKNGVTVDNATVTWTVTDEAGTSSILTDSAFTPETAGTYTITATYTPEGGGAVSDSITIVVTEEAVATRDPIVGDWYGEVKFSIGVDTSILGLTYGEYTMELNGIALISVVDDGYYNGGNNFTLRLGEISTDGVVDGIILDVFMGILESYVPEYFDDDGYLVLFEDEEWVKNADGTYTVEAYIDETQTIPITVTVENENGKDVIEINFSGTINFGIEVTISIVEQTVSRTSDIVTGVTFGETGGIINVTEGQLGQDPDFTVVHMDGSVMTSEEYAGTVTWSSSDESVATVDQNGAVTLVSGASGLTVITVTVEGGFSASYVLVVGASAVAEDDEILGVWAGDTTFTVTVPLTIGTRTYTVTASVKAVATKEGNTLDLVISKVSYTSLGKTYDYEAIQTINIWTNASLYKFDTTYYVVGVSDGAYSITKITYANHQIKGTFAASVSFTTTSSGDTYEGDIEFTATLDKQEESRVAVAEGEAELADGENTATFENGNITITEISSKYGEVTYILEGEAATMTKAQAEVFWNGVAAAHDAYVIITITLKAGETVSWTASDGQTKSYTYEDLAEDDGVLGIIIRISGKLEDGTQLDANSFEYTITTYGGDGQAVYTVKHVVDVSGVTIPEDPHSYADPDDADYGAKANIYWNWDGIQDRSLASGTVDVYILCTECGEWIKYTTNYAVDQNDGTSFTASVEAGGYSFTGTQAREVEVGADGDLQAALNKGGLVKVAADTTGAYEVSGNVTLTIAENITLSNADGDTASTITVKSGASLTIEGEGTVDTIVTGTAALYVEEGATVYLNGGTFTRSQEAGTRTWDETSGSWTFSNGGNSYYTIVNHGTMEIGEGVEVKNSGAYSSMIENGWYYPSKNTTGATATLTIAGGSFEGGLNTVKNDDCGVLVITAGTFKNSVQGVIMNYSSLEISDGEFVQESATGWTVYNVTGSNGEASANISGGNFSSLGYETIINCEGSAMTISGGEFTNSESTGYGTVVVNIGTLTIEDGEFEQTVEWGWTIGNIDYNYTGADPEMTIDGGSFKAAKGGIVIDADDGTIVINGGEFSAEYCADATQWEYSVVVEAWGDGTIIINGGTFVAGYADNGDGTCNYNDVLYAEDGGTITVYGGVFQGWIETWDDTGYGPSSITLYGGYFNLNPSDYNDVSFVATGYMAYAFTYEVADETYATMYGVIRSVAALGEEDTFAGENFSLGSFEYHDIVINEDGSIEYQITATGGMMDSDQNVAFGGGDEQYSKEGDLYVSFKIWVNAGETISWTKNGEEMSETFNESGWFVFVIRVDTSNLPEGTTSCSIGSRNFTISDDEGNATTIIVNFGHIDFPEEYVLGGGVTEPSDGREIVKEVYINFGDGDTYNETYSDPSVTWSDSKLNSEEYTIVTDYYPVDEDGIVIYDDSQSYGAGVSDGSLSTEGGEYGGETYEFYGDYTNYFMIDLSSYSDCYVEISIVYEQQSTSSVAKTGNGEAYADMVALTTVLSTANVAEEENILASQVISEATTKTELTWSGNVDELGEDMVLYLIYGDALNIYSITVTIYEA